MTRKKILLVGGSINQTRMTHAVARHLQDEYDCYFSPAYCDGALETARKHKLLEFTVLGDQLRMRAEKYYAEHNLSVDYGGRQHDYDLVVLTSDLIIQKNIAKKPIILIQEGMTDRETMLYWLVKWLKLPRWFAGTSTNGLSHSYNYFCVASQGYRDLFIHKGCDPEKVVVTGIPNFDNVAEYRNNDFPLNDYVLVATSNARETYKPDDRQAFLHWALKIAGSRRLVFKLHPAENAARATAEIKKIAPHAQIFTDGNTEHMIANCSALITQYSTCVYVGLAMGKECHSYFDIDELKKLTPWQNNGTSGWNIAQYCIEGLENHMISLSQAPLAHARPLAKPQRRLGEPV